MKCDGGARLAGLVLLLREQSEKVPRGPAHS